ncbi:MAG: ABC transporter permease, partial [Clostridiales bacterium]|nr:ABC transporter permease [Clostridiales bacterium]
FADLTAEGSFALGGAVVASLITKGLEPALSSLIAFLAGTLAGLCTGILNTKLKIPAILSGILTMIGLYSINIRIMGTSNTSLLRLTTVITYFENLFKIPKIYATLILGVLVVGIIIAVLYWFFGTEVGSAIRATGDNENMCRALGINTDNTKILALMIANGLIALSGAMVAQQQTFSDVNMGIGAIVIGLASIIIGETFMSQKFPFWAKMIFIVLGSVIYRVLITLIIYANIMEPYDIKLLTAVLVIIALALPRIKSLFKNNNFKRAKNNNRG